MILQLNPTIDVSTTLGDGTAMFIIDYGIDVNTVWVVRYPGGEVKHLYSDDIRIYGNPMNGSGWDVSAPWLCPESNKKYMKNHKKISPV